MFTSIGMKNDSLKSTCLRCGSVVEINPEDCKMDTFGNSFFRCSACDIKNIAVLKISEEGLEHYDFIRCKED